MDMTLKGKENWGRYSHAFIPAIHMTWFVKGFLKGTCHTVRCACAMSHNTPLWKSKEEQFALLTLISCAIQQQEVMKVQHATEQHVKQELVHQVKLQSNSQEQTGYNVSQWMTTNGANQVRTTLFSRFSFVISIRLALSITHTQKLNML